MYSTKKDISYSHIVILWFINVLSECIQKLGLLRLLSPKARIEVLQRDTKNWGIGRRLLRSSFDLYSPINMKEDNNTVYSVHRPISLNFKIFAFDNIIQSSSYQINSMKTIFHFYLISAKLKNRNINRNIEKLSISRILLV